jgi:hypothetical protein
MILNKAQAEVVYRAMATLNNVSGIIDVRLPVGRIDTYIRVRQEIMSDDVIVSVTSSGATRGHEQYEDQSAFAMAYGLEYGGQSRPTISIREQVRLLAQTDQ